MNNEEITREFKEFVMNHDLDEEEYDALETWVKNGNSPYSNPDHYCMCGDEISFMKWYWILLDSHHPEHKNLLDYRYWNEDYAGKINEYPALLKARIEEFLNMDYRDTTLNDGQDWYAGGTAFLSLEETKVHLLAEIEYYKEAIRQLLYMAQNVENALSEMDLRGNLFADVMIVGEVLGIAEMYAEEFLEARKEIDRFEDRFRRNYSGNSSIARDDLPF